MRAKETLEFLNDHLYKENDTFSSVASWLHTHASVDLQLYAYTMLMDLVGLDDQEFQSKLHGTLYYLREFIPNLPHKFTHEERELGNKKEAFHREPCGSDVATPFYQEIVNYYRAFDYTVYHGPFTSVVELSGKMIV